MPPIKNMSAKRRPTSELNHDNWNDDEEPEETGEFRKASADEIKNRVIRLAKRRTGLGKSSASVAGGEQASTEAPKPSVFSSFGGFAKSDNKPSSSPFSFLSASSTAAPLSDAAKKSSNVTSSSTTINPIKTVPSTSSSANNKNNFFSTSASTTTTTVTSFALAAKNAVEKDPIALQKLAGLNRKFVEWINKSLETSSICILTPMFADYDRYLKEIAASVSPKNNGVDDKSKEMIGGAKSTTSTVQPTNSTSNFSFGFNNTTAQKKPDDTTAKLTTNLTGSTVPASSGSLGFSFSSTSSASGTGFSFASNTSGKPFTFENVSKPTTTTDDAKKNDDDDGEYVPPEPEYIPVETDSLYSKRCKVFIKKDDDYKSIGVGTLYIKSVNDDKKTQLLVRTDTNQGVVLLNILLTNDTTAKRLGKNNVMMVCLPTPDAKPPPSVVLVRVKDSDEADELLKQIDKYKK